MVKITGKTRDAAHLKAHLTYISRNGQHELEGPDGVKLADRREVTDLAFDWAALADLDPRRRSTSPLSRSIVLSMPEGTDPLALRDAARTFAADTFTGRFDYVFTLHTDTPRPHVHLSVCAHGHTGQRLNPKKADLDQWRQRFAQALRDRGVAAEATPRRARGVSRKAERTPLRKMRDRFERDGGPMSRHGKMAYIEAAKLAAGGPKPLAPWEAKLVRRQEAIRGLYLAQARLLAASDIAEDRRLAAKVAAFVQAMPAPDTQRLALARQLRAANRSAQERGSGGDGADRTRSR